MAMVLISGALYGAWTALEHYDNTRAAYREELERSRILNFTNQQRISELMQENAELRAELDAMPVFVESTPPVGIADIPLPEEDLPPSAREVSRSDGGSHSPLSATPTSPLPEGGLQNLEEDE